MATSAERRKGLGTALTREESYVDGRLTRTAFVSLAILTFITFVGNFTQLQLSAALPSIVDEFGINVTTGQWLTSVFQLVMGVMVPLTAFLTRRFSTRQIVIVSMAVFTLGSVCAWLAPTFPVLLLGRLLEAVGTGVMWPVLQITVFSIYPLSRRGAAMGMVGIAMSVAPAIGPTLGGLQTDANGWRSIFLTLTVIGALSLVAACLWLHNFGEHDATARADFFSVVLSILGFGGLMFGFTNIENYPFSDPMVWGSMLVGVVGIVWFVLRQMRHAHIYKEYVAKTGAVDPSGAVDSSDADAPTDSAVPSGVRGASARSSHGSRGGAAAPEPPLLDLGVLRNRSFTVGTLTASLAFFAFSSILVIMPLYIQNDRGFSATMSGLIMLPGAIGQCISQLFGGKALDRFGARPVALFGAIVLTVGTVGMSLISADTWIWWVSICQFVRQIGMGSLLMPITTWSLNCLEPDELSAGSAVTNTARQVAGAMGAPILVILMETFTAVRHAAGVDMIAANIFGIQWALRISAFLCLVMVILVAFGVRGDGAGSTREATRRALARLRK